jgi:tetratricopeptide (TPR) repeat protein
MLLNFASLYGTHGELFSGMAELEEAFVLGTQSDDPELRFTVQEEKIDRLQFTGRLAEAAARADTYVELGRALAPGSVVRSWLPVAWSLARRAWVWIELGRLEAAEVALRECLEQLRGNVRVEPESWVETLLAKRAALAGDGDAALFHARRGFVLAEKIGSNLSRIWAEESLGVGLACAGDPNAAVEHLDAALRIARETRTWLTIEAELLAHLAEARLGAGEAEAAQRTAAEAIETARRKQTPVWEAQAHLALARVLLARSGAGAQDEIERALGSARSLIERTEARVFEPHVFELRAELARRLGDEAGAGRALREAQRLFSGIGAPGHAARVARRLG